MKTYLRGYEITKIDVWAALGEWLSGESGRKNRHRIKEEYGTEERLVNEIYWEMRNRSLTLRPIRRYKRYEPTNGKVRTIGVSSVKQQVCDYLVVTLLQEMFDKKIGFYQVASVKGKGQRMCRCALKKWVKEGGYHVKLDIRKCYPSTKSDVVMRLYEKYVGSKDVLYVVSAILSTYKGCLEIGSFFSLKTMQLVLSFAYHHVESLHKTRRGKMIPLAGHQIWHMDDVILVGRDKRNLKSAVRTLAKYLSDVFSLSIKDWKICLVSDSEPLDLGGWVVRDGRETLRSGTFLRGRKSFRMFKKTPSVANARRCASYWGWFIHGSTEMFMSKNGMGAVFSRARHVISIHDRITARERLEQHERTQQANHQGNQASVRHRHHTRADERVA